MYTTATSGSWYKQFVTERDRTNMNRVRMNLEPTFISTETQTCREEDLVAPDRTNTYRRVQQQSDRPSLIKQYGGQIFRQPMEICSYDHNRPRYNTNNVSVWEEMIQQRILESKTIRSHKGEQEVQLSHDKQQDQRYETEVKQMEDKGMMTLYPELFQSYIHSSFKCPEYRYVERQNTNFIGDRNRNTLEHQHPVVNSRRQDNRCVERQDVNIISDSFRNTQDCNVLPVVDSRPQDRRYIERRNTNIIDDRSGNTNTRGHQPLPLQPVEDWIQIDASDIHENALSQNRRNNIIPNPGYQQDMLNTAMMEPRQLSRDSRINVNDQEWYDRRTPHTTGSDNLFEQQMSLMREMFQMVSVQNAHMRDQINTRNKLRITPEKFAGNTSFYSFMAQFENCCEINGWEEHEKLLMLRSSLTGNASAVLWDLGADKQCSYRVGGSS